MNCQPSFWRRYHDAIRKNLEPRTFRSFVETAVDFLHLGINVLIVDIFPPSERDPQGIHNAIRDEICEEPFEVPTEKPPTVASYSAGDPITAYLEPVAVGELLPDMPVFLDPETYIPVSLETTYIATWQKCPEPLRKMIHSVR